MQNRVSQDLFLGIVQDCDIHPVTSIYGLNNGILPANFPISDFASLPIKSSSERPRAMVVGGRSLDGTPVNTRWNFEYETPANSENQPFAGRAQELIQIEHKLKEEQRTAIVYGIGGIGKTALVKEYLCIHQNDYDGILYITFSKSVKNSVCNDRMLNISDLKFNPEKYGNLTRYYKVKMQALQELMEKGKYLLVLDDCNTEFDQNLDDLIDLSGDKIITTRINPAVWGYSGIEVCSFQNRKEWNEFLNLYTKKSLAEDEKKKIWEYIREVHGHTLAVMLKIYNRDNEFNTKIVGKDLLQRFPLKKREKEILMYLSIMPTEGIPCSLFEIIAQLKDGELQRLQQFLLIQVVRTSFDGEKYISLHPLIAEAVKKELPADVIKCRSLLKGFEKYLNGENPEKKDLWETSYENNRKLEGCIFAVINAFPEPVPWMATTFDSLATFLWVQGYFEEAEEYTKVSKTLGCYKTYCGT